MAPPFAPWYSWLLSALLLTSVSCLKAGAAEITKLTEPELADGCSNTTISCTAQPVDATIWWTKDTVNVSLSQRVAVLRETKDKSVVSHLTVDCVALSDRGDYTCHVSGGKHKTVTLRVRAVPELVSSGGATVRLGDSATVSCSFRASPLPAIDWSADKRPIKHSTPGFSLSARNVSDTEVESLLTIANVSAKDDGQLTCSAANDAGRTDHTVRLVVQKAPEVHISQAVAVGRSIFVNWTVADGNAPLEPYRLQYMQVGSGQWQNHTQPIAANTTSLVVSRLAPSRGYVIRLIARNAVGESVPAEHGRHGELITQERDPVYKPLVSVRAATRHSLTLSWSPPPRNISANIQSYRLMRVDPQDPNHVVERMVFHPRTRFLWPDLMPDRTYTISVMACNDLVNVCGPWSKDAHGTTLVDKEVTPRHVALRCQLERSDPATASVLVTWQPPINVDAVLAYTVTVTGESEYLRKDGSLDDMAYGPDSQIRPPTEQTAFFQVSPNTNYTVHVCAGRLSAGCSGGGASQRCSVGAGLPSAQSLRSYNWWRVKKDNSWLLVIQVDRVPERNGPICCYRVVMVRLRPEETLDMLPHPSNVTILAYDEVQARGSGAYLADSFGHDFDRAQYVWLGDGKVSDGQPCRSCRPSDGRRRRHALSRLGRRDVPPPPPQPPPLLPHDGPLQDGARYSAFVQLVVRQEDGQLAVAHTGYTSPLTPSPPATSEDSAVFGIVLGVVCVLVLFVLVLLVTLYVRRYGMDMAVSRALRDMLGSVRGQSVADSVVPDLPPVGRHELISAYQDRHRDSDLGFRREFECLPQRLHDRTTYASEAMENFKKNRYPDIRAYDQTRVKLSQVDGIQSTEYINANFVWGYKERKKFICAQGPLEATIVDFWRMAWEQCCELMIMLTNLEEVGRTKCAKYWPEEGETTYGTITVSLAQEKPYSDYIQRVLSLSRPRADGTVEMRRITHLHYLVWKDFMAPEYPTGILRFIKRINEMYSVKMGPILVHCSAGVGRTGTLVAIDSLLQEMEEEGEVTIFNAICDLRHQRNYLVQSLKQYIFVYRALMEFAQFGDTEIPAEKLAATYRQLQGQDAERSRTRLEDEFRRLGEVLEERKAFTVGSSDENKEKNRLDYIVPYDVNRVILAPLPSRPLDTYINASFIQGYDVTETYIITQEPLTRTCADFWRMVLDLEISAVVMLSAGPTTPPSEPASDLPEDEQAAAAGADSYWPELDRTDTHDHITVKCVGARDVPQGYTWRNFNVASLKGNDAVTTSQLQLVGWPPTDPQRVVTPLIQLISRLDEVQEASLSPGPVVVHCSDGGSGASVVVALCVLMHQLTRERRIDVFQTVRKLRSQRQGMVQEMAHYDLLYRVMLEYAALSESCGNGHS